jgi:HEPN domain-containing protein/predicted nucleotidyltransferase
MLIISSFKWKIYLFRFPHSLTPKKNNISRFSPLANFSPYPTFTTEIRQRETYHPKQPFQLKTSLEHLPDHKRYELNSIMIAIVRLVQPEMIVLFGSYSRGDWVDERHYEDGTLYEYKSDYDILVVTEHHQDMPPGLGKSVRQKIKRAERLQSTPHIIFHDINFLNKELEEGQYFFRDILREGILLYSTGKYELATPKDLSDYQRGQKAQVYFNQWVKKGDNLFRVYKYSFEEAMYDTAIFQLHQATESYYSAIHLVFTDYKPKTHDLRDLNQQAGYADARFKTVFPDQTEEEKRLFILLIKSYIDSRYKLGYKVDAADLQWLGDRVKRLKELTVQLCLERIGNLLNN